MPSEELLKKIIHSGALPTLPAVAAKVLLVSGNEDVELSQIAAVLAQDASLAGKLLKVVNSPFYGFRHPVGTISKAVAALGINTVRSLVLSFSLLEVRDNRGGSAFDYEQFWERSLASAVAARWISEELAGTDPEEAFMAGLLANMGEMILARGFPDEYGTLLPRTGNGGADPEAEREMLGTDHCLLGAAVARHWRLPPFLEEAIGYHHAPEDCPCENNYTRRLVRLTYLAGIFADLFHSPAPHRKRDLFIRRAKELLGLDEPVFHRLAAGVHHEVNRAAAYFGLKAPPRISAEEILQEANLRLGQLNLSYEQTNRELMASRQEILHLNSLLQQGSESPRELVHWKDLEERDGVPARAEQEKLEARKKPFHQG